MRQIQTLLNPGESMPEDLVDMWIWWFNLHQPAEDRMRVPQRYHNSPGRTPLSPHRHPATPHRTMTETTRLVEGGGGQEGSLRTPQKGVQLFGTKKPPTTPQDIA